jgi:hypothetical protein
MYVISVSTISIKTYFNQMTRVELKCVQYSEEDYILFMTSLFFRSFTNVGLLYFEPHHNSSLSRFVVILLHTTGSTWYNVVYQHTNYVMGKGRGGQLNDKGWIKMCTIFWGKLHFVHDVIIFSFIHQCRVTVFCLTFQWYDVMCHDLHCQFI